MISMTINVSNTILVRQNFETMNSNYSKSKSKSSFNFDLDLGSSRPKSKSLNDQKNQTSSSSYALYSSYSSTQSKPTSQPNKPSWTHQPVSIHPATRLRVFSSGTATSMVDDILQELDFVRFNHRYQNHGQSINF
jgi:hypothetical protein